ncbi:MAG: serine hydrolase domain-containing protein [Nannocystaceae bacterium]
MRSHTSSHLLRRACLALASATLLLACEASPPAHDGPDEEPEAVALHEPLPSSLEARVTTYLEQYGRHWPTFRFHGAVLVARGDQIAVDRAYGQADLITGVPNETSTVFRLGTLSAQLTAGATLRLAEAGIIELSDPVSQYVPGWPGGDDMTIEHLLSYRSGIPSFTEDPAFERWKRGPQPLPAILKTFRRLPLEFTPGTDMAPSNSNMVLLGAVLEAATGEPYEQVVTRTVLEPLGMSHTRYAITDEPQALGMVFDESEILKVVTDVHPSAFGPAGGWLSTTGDLLAWVRGLRDEQFLSARSVGHMQGRLGDGMGYAWVGGEVAGHEVVTWPGLIDGFNASLLYVPHDDTTIIVLSNSEVLPAGQLAQDIGVLVYDDELVRHEEPQAVPLTMEHLRPAVGRYLLTRGTEEALTGADPEQVALLAEIFVREQGEHLVLDIPSHGIKRMHPEGDGRFFFKDLAGTRAQLTVREGRPNLLTLLAGNTELRFIAIAG